MAVVRDEDLGFKEIEKQLRILEKSYALVGIQEGTVTKPGVKAGRKKEAGLSMAEIGFVNEFGAGNVPPRPFIRSAVDLNSNQIQAQLNGQYSQILDGRIKARAALQLVGVYVEGLIKQRIRAITTPPNAPSTIAKKKSSKPLIDFGQMIQSIASVVFTDR